MLIGKLHASLGKQYIAGEDVSNGLSMVHKYIGVCPQFDVVWNDLTVQEHLAFQARQRGVPSNMVFTPRFIFLHITCIECSLFDLFFISLIDDFQIYAKVQQAAMSVGLDGDGFFTKAGDLSGGMRRRLSIAMSLVGDPPIIFMDGQ